MILYLPDELIPLEIGGVTFKLRQLSAQQKSTLFALSMKGQKDEFALIEGVKRAIKYALRDVDGVFRSSGEPYCLEFEKEGDVLSDRCVDELMHLPVSNTLGLTCVSLIRGITDPLTDPQGKPIVGVKILKPESKGKKKKAAR